MATIYALPNASEWEKAANESWDEHFNRTRKMMEAMQRKADHLGEKEYKGALISFPVADGSAVYFVQSIKPLILCHVPYMDGYRAHGLIEKALNASEVKKQVNKERAFAKIFAKGKR